MSCRFRECVALLCLLLATSVQADDWKPADGPLMTRWAAEVTPENAWREYPRPQMVRKCWMNLNGLWDYSIIPAATSTPPTQWQGEILVPFAVESALSGVMKSVGPENTLWYRRAFATPKMRAGERLLLHFGAVDWTSRVWINGRHVGDHTGGYDPFAFDITDALRADGHQQVVVKVNDPTDGGTQPRGKQRNKPHGIWYTPVTGIWQTVWLETVPASYVESIQIIPNVDRKAVTVTVNHCGPSNQCVRVAAPGLKAIAEGEVGQSVELSLDRFQLWSPANPQLYDLTIELLDDGRTIDRVDSYFAMRKIEVATDINGIPRIHLNDEPLFQYGPLDQGWWPDGLYTAPSDEAMAYDLETTQQLGFNMVRKHVKVEPQRWYWYCDRMGLLVWQDMPNGDAHAPWPLDGAEIERTPESTEQFQREWKALIDTHRNHPCIVVWVPFNEAWGQFQTVKWTEWTEQYDPTRLVISASGGNDFGVGHIHDIHQYPGPEAPPAEAARVAVLGEYGGLGLPMKGHTWRDQKNWGYRKFETRDALQKAYLDLLSQLRPLIESRLSAAVYTQTTDVEIEVNGLMTYDRRVLKFDADTLADAHRKLYAPLRQLSDDELSQAYTVAYWRFEDGQPGQLVAHSREQRDGVATADVSGHRNHVYAYSDRNAPRHSKDVPRRKIPRLGFSNNGSLDDTGKTDGPTRDLFTDPGRSRTHMNAINTFPFNQWTIELSVKPAELGRPQTLVGKDGKPTDHPNAPVQVQIREDGRIAVVAIDSTGTVRTGTSRQPVSAGRWYNIAVLCDGRTMKLLVDQGDGYEEQETTEFSGSLINSVGTWTLGRGFHNERLTFDARATIDEVRVSSIALPTNLLLWSIP